MSLHKQARLVETFIASDGCEIAEVIHPVRDGTDSGVSLARAVVDPGQATKAHVLDFVEIYYIISGRGVIHLDGRAAEVGPEDCVYIPAGRRQWIQNTGDEDLVFLCVCTPAYDPHGDHPA